MDTDFMTARFRVMGNGIQRRGKVLPSMTLVSANVKVKELALSLRASAAGEIAPKLKQAPRLGST
jgi:hypothetical protein